VFTSLLGRGFVCGFVRLLVGGGLDDARGGGVPRMSAGG